MKGTTNPSELEWDKFFGSYGGKTRRIPIYSNIFQQYIYIYSSNMLNRHTRYYEPFGDPGITDKTNEARSFQLSSPVRAPSSTTVVSYLLRLLAPWLILKFQHVLTRRPGLVSCGLLLYSTSLCFVFLLNAPQGS